MATNEIIKPYVIGLDLGGTNSVFGIVDSRGEIKATTAIKTQGYEKVEDYVNAAVEALNIIILGGIVVLFLWLRCSVNGWAVFLWDLPMMRMQRLLVR